MGMACLGAGKRVGPFVDMEKGFNRSYMSRDDVFVG